MGRNCEPAKGEEKRPENTLQGRKEVASPDLLFHAEKGGKGFLQNVNNICRTPQRRLPK